MPIFNPTKQKKQTQKESAMSPQKKFTGLCLSGGGALGFAHIGALQAMEEHDLTADYISGTSMGSSVGVMYAAGYSPKQIMEIIIENKVYKVAKLIAFNRKAKGGFAKHAKLQDLLEKYIPENSFESLPKRLSVCCVDIRQGKVCYFNSGGNLREYVIASASIPYVFEIKQVDGVDYVDGGVSNHFPVEPLLEASCKKIIGINVVNFTPLESVDSGAIAIPMLFSLMMESMDRDRFPKCDFYIPIKGLSTQKYHTFSFRNYKYIYQCGYDTMKQYIEEHPEILI
jgi:NTE family protein